MSLYCIYLYCYNLLFNELIRYSPTVCLLITSGRAYRPTGHDTDTAHICLAVLSLSYSDLIPIDIRYIKPYANRLICECDIHLT